MNASLVHRRGSEDGIALPMTLIIMCLITALTVAFLAFTSTEPAIASNQMMNAQARAIAESGVERALWALTKGDAAPGTAGSLADPLPAPVPAPYDGSQYVAVGVGGFIVTVGPGGVVNERTITAVGYVPNNVNPIAIKKIQTTVTKVKWLDPPCAVCAGGEDHRLDGERRPILRRGHADGGRLFGGTGQHERSPEHHRAVGRLGHAHEPAGVELRPVPVHRQRHGRPEGARESERDVLPGQPDLDVAAAGRHHLRRYAVR